MGRRLIYRVVAIAFAFAVAGCGNRVTKEEAHRLVERYNQATCEAYRRCDVNLINPVVGPNTVDGKRLTGLIGVRLDMGISLDAQLLTLEIASVDLDAGILKVRTREQWRYRDRKIGTGETVGAESDDTYDMLYEFSKVDGKWMVSETRFAAPPQVGRTATPWAANREALHGIFSGPATDSQSMPG